MYHTIEFRTPVRLDLEIAPERRMERHPVQPGSRFCAQIRPYVVATAYGPVEVADLYFNDGSTTRAVPFAAFTFVEGRA
jgi:hypothetical protein